MSKDKDAAGADDDAPRDILTIPTRQGDGRLHLSLAEPGWAGPVLLLGHGAGGGVAAPDLVALATELPALGVGVARFEQPWRVAGRKVASRPPTLDAAWTDMLAVLRQSHSPAQLFFGGRSAGARVACRTAADAGAAGVVCLAFPLHPPGRPETSRAAELAMPDSPVLVLQGTRDPFGAAADVAAAAVDLPHVTVCPVPGADHSMRVIGGCTEPPPEVRDVLVGTVAAFCLGH